MFGTECCLWIPALRFCSFNSLDKYCCLSHPCSFNWFREGNTKLVFGQTFCTARWSSTEISPLLLIKIELEFLENPQYVLLARLSMKYIREFFQSICIYLKKTFVETMHKASKNSSIKKKDVLIKVWSKQPAKLRAIDFFYPQILQLLLQR